MNDGGNSNASKQSQRADSECFYPSNDSKIVWLVYQRSYAAVVLLKVSSREEEWSKGPLKSLLVLIILGGVIRTLVPLLFFLT